MIFKKLLGLILTCVSVGMFLVLFMPSCIYFLATIFACIGLYLLFYR